MIALLATIGAVPFATLSSSGAPSVVVPEMLAHVPGSRMMYVVDLVGCEDVKCLRLFRTSVSATTFSDVTLPPLSRVSGSLTGLDRLVFATANVGYALVGAKFPWTLYETVDGARTWQRVKIASRKSIVGLTVSASSMYTVTALCSSIGDNCRDYQVNRSTLNAEGWTSTAMPHPATTQVGDGYFNPNVGAFGDDVWIDEITHAGSTIFTSHDGGRTFVPITANKLASVSGCAITAASARSLWAECPTGMMVSFFHSSDAGETWSNISQYEFAGTGGGAFDPVSTTLAYLAYDQQQPFDRITNVGGKIINLGKLACAKYSSLADLSFSDETHGLVLCSPDGAWTSAQLLKTSDGGVHWIHVPAN